MEKADEAINGRIFLAVEMGIGTATVEVGGVVVLQQVVQLLQDDHLQYQPHQKNGCQRTVCEVLFQSCFIKRKLGLLPSNQKHEGKCSLPGRVYLFIKSQFP